MTSHVPSLGACTSTNQCAAASARAWNRRFTVKLPHDRRSGAAAVAPSSSDAPATNRTRRRREPVRVRHDFIFYFSWTCTPRAMPVGVASTSVNGRRTGHCCAEGSDAESPTRSSASNVYAEGQSYAEGRRVSAKGDLRRGATSTVALGVGYADGLPWLRRGL
jgi:hypothetical protein